MRPKTSAFKSMIVTVPIDRFIALANDDASGSSVTSPPYLRARCSEPLKADRKHGLLLGKGSYACWLFAYAHTRYLISSHESSSPAM
jgi:hypothetical protein